MAKKEIFDPKILSQYDALVKNIKGLERKGATMPYTSLNGHMFSFLDKEGRLGLRLPEIEREEFITKYKSKLCEAHGAVLKEYVLVPDKLFRDTKELAPYFKLSYKYVSGLKPKK